MERWLSGGKSAGAVAADLGPQRPAAQDLEATTVPASPPGANAGAAPSGEPPVAAGTDRRAAPVRHSKKNLGHPRRTQRERFERIKAMRTERSLHQLCAAFGVSRSGYQVWVRRRPGLRQAADADLLRLPCSQPGHLRPATTARLAGSTRTSLRSDTSLAFVERGRLESKTAAQVPPRQSDRQQPCDRGVQYASQTYRQALTQAGAVCSMSPVTTTQRWKASGAL